MEFARDGAQLLTWLLGGTEPPWGGSRKDAAATGCSTASVAAGSGSGSGIITVTGLTPHGFLRAEDADGAAYELHPDGNSLDFFRGLVRRKL